MGLLLWATWKLQLVEYAAVYLLIGVGHQKHIIPVLQSLHGLPTPFQELFKVLVLTYKALNNSDPTT